MNNFNQFWNKDNNQNTQNQQTQQQSNSQTQTPPQPSILTKLMNSCLPVLLEQFTGQVMPTANNNNTELQPVLSQAITLLQQIANNQQTLDQRLVRLEARASQQFNGLSQQIQNFKGIRLSHERESKQIEFNGNGNFQHQQEN